MRTILMIGMVCYVVASSKEHDISEKESEREIEKQFRQAFRSAFSNPSDEVGEFLNQTFGQGGDASEIAERFRLAWQGASQGVRRFVNETYWNITRVLEGEKVPGYGEEAMERVSSMISEHKHMGDQLQGDPNETKNRSVVDAAWNYFKNEFSPSKPESSKSSEPVSAAMMAPTGSSWSHNRLFLMVISLLASVILVFQTTLNRNSFVNKQVYNEPSRVPSGYVRIA
jgi:hypothetical protein